MGLVHGCGADVELVHQRTLVTHLQAHRLARGKAQLLGLEVVVVHDNLDGTADLLRVAGLTALASRRARGRCCAEQQRRDHPVHCAIHACISCC